MALILNNDKSDLRVFTREIHDQPRDNNYT